MKKYVKGIKLIEVLTDTVHQSINQSINQQKYLTELKNWRIASLVCRIRLEIK